MLAMKLRLTGVCLVAALPVLCHADVYKCVDSEGRITYTNSRSVGRGCSQLSSETRVSTVPATRRTGSSSSAASGDFPKVDGQTQKTRDNDRRSILEKELATEREQLDTAKKNLTAAEATQQGGERNYQKYVETLQQKRDDVALHERNVEALQKEIANLK